MYFGIWIDAERQYFDTAHFPESLQQFLIKERVFIFYWELLKLTTFSTTITITKMSKMPLIADPRYAMDEESKGSGKQS